MIVSAQLGSANFAQSGYLANNASSLWSHELGTQPCLNRCDACQSYDGARFTFPNCSIILFDRHSIQFLGRVLNLNSKHSMSQKIIIIDKLKNRAFKLSSPEFHQYNSDKIKTILREKRDTFRPLFCSILY